MFALKAGAGKLRVKACNSHASYATYQLSNSKLYYNFSIIQKSCEEASNRQKPSKAHTDITGLPLIAIMPVTSPCCQFNF